MTSSDFPDLLSKFPSKLPDIQLNKTLVASDYARQVLQQQTEQILAEFDVDQFNKNLAEVKQLGFDEQFIRKWNYYLCYCEAAFEMRNINVMQMVYSRPNNINR